MDYCLRKTEDEEWHSKYLVQLNTQSGHLMLHKDKLK